MNGPNGDREMFILFVPRRTIECDEMLTEHKMFNEANISQINMDLVPLDDDLLSLEQPDNFLHHMLQDDDTYKVYAQCSIHRLESVYGKIHHKFGIGATASQIINRIEKNRLNIDQSSANSTYQNQESEIDALIMFDRDIDTITPFCVMQTFEGFLDENVGIKTCQTTVKNSVLYPDPKVREELKKDEHGVTEIELTSETPLYVDIRDKHFDMAGPYLNQQLREIQAILARNAGQRESTEEIKKFIDRVKTLNPTKAKSTATMLINIADKYTTEQRNVDYL